MPLWFSVPKENCNSISCNCLINRFNNQNTTRKWNHYKISFSLAISKHLYRKESFHYCSNGFPKENLGIWCWVDVEWADRIMRYQGQWWCQGLSRSGLFQPSFLVCLFLQWPDCGPRTILWASNNQSYFVGHIWFLFWLLEIKTTSYLNYPTPSLHKG